MSEIRPIETVFLGYRFRSRLEARWAVFFEALGLEWEYEPEGFELGGGERYLPDFYLPQMDSHRGMYVEVKREGAPFDDRCRKLAFGQSCPVLLVEGAPAPASYRYFAKGNEYRPDYDGDACFSDKYLSPRQSECRLFVSIGCPEDYSHDFNPQVAWAAREARQARFEHNERPRRYR